MLLQTPVAGASAGYRGCAARVRSFFHAPARGHEQRPAGDAQTAMCRIRPDLAGHKVAASARALFSTRPVTAAPLV
jgi:hypothetical protein